MHKILVIGNDSLPHKKMKSFLSDQGFDVTSCKTMTQSLKRLDTQEAIIVSNALMKDKAFQDVLKLTEDIPMLIIAEKSPPAGMQKWLKGNLIYPLIDPSAKELIFYLKKAIADSRIFIKHHEMKNRLEQAEKELSLFEELSKTLTSSLDLDSVVDSFMEHITKNTGAKAWALYLLDKESNHLYLEKTHRKKKKKEKKIILELGEGTAGWVAQEGVPVVIPDTSSDMRTSAKKRKKDIEDKKSIICVPLKSKGDILGVLEIYDKKRDLPFTKNDLDMILKIVDHAAVGIERASLYQKMADLAITDDLTKLFNSRYLNRTIEIELSRSQRYETSVSLIFMDLDFFKQINDQHGHLVGSKVLVELGQLLIKGLRSVDIVSRYGGDEFVIVLPQTPPSIATDIAYRLRRSINKHVFLRTEGLNLRLTASFGIASYPESADTKEELLRLADEAMYEVKNRTRDGVYVIQRAH